MPSATDSAIPENPPDLSQVLPKLVPRRRSKVNPAKKTSNAPETTPLTPPIPQERLSFLHPTRRILSPHDHELYLASPTHTLIVSFIFTITDSIRDTPIASISKQPLHPTVSGLISILESTEALLETCPPDDTGSRFGNPAFRTFLTTLSTHLDSWHQEQLHIKNSGALEELHTYFVNSLGSSLRIDYGSGHELNFSIYLLCLYLQSELPASTFPSLALVLFPRYLRLMRSLQSTYYLEPAGSHGVWGLDDYHFLPFLFGASQLCGHPFLRPLAIHSQATIDAYADDYLYLDMVRHVNETKTVQGLRWHSPMLDDISGVREGWVKICGGMKKMFLNEVLGKLVVMQHFLFGGLVPAVEGMSEEADVVEEEQGAANAQMEDAEGEHRVAEGHEDHFHNKDSWGDCCGIKVPSSVGAVQEMRKRMGGDGGLRRLPFD